MCLQLILRREPHLLKADVTLSSKGALQIIVFNVDLMCILHVCIFVCVAKMHMTVTYLLNACSFMDRYFIYFF